MKMFNSPPIEKMKYTSQHFWMFPKKLILNIQDVRTNVILGEASKVGKNSPKWVVGLKQKKFPTLPT